MRTFRQVVFALLLTLATTAACTTHLEYPTYQIKIAPSADAKADLAAMDAVLTSSGFRSLASDPRIGRSGILPCVGNIHIEGMYALNSTSGAYVGKIDDNRWSIVMMDTSKLGASFSDRENVIFGQLIDGLKNSVGSERVDAPKSWGAGILRCNPGSTHSVTVL